MVRTKNIAISKATNIDSIGMHLNSEKKMWKKILDHTYTLKGGKIGKMCPNMR